MLTFKVGDRVRVKTDKEIDKYKLDNPEELEGVRIMYLGETSKTKGYIVYFIDKELLSNKNAYPIRLIPEHLEQTSNNASSYAHYELEHFKKNIKLYNYLLKNDKEKTSINKR